MLMTENFIILLNKDEISQIIYYDWVYIYIWFTSISNILTQAFDI